MTDAPLRFFPGVPPTRFRLQMEALMRCSTVLPLGELVTRMGAGDIPPRCTAITFDDGYRDNYEQAFPVLRELGLPATIFLATGPLDTGVPLWHDRVFHSFERAPDGPLEVLGRTLPMRPLESRSRTLREVLALLRSLVPAERDRTVDRIEEQAGALGASPGAGLMLSWEQVRDMGSHGITFGAHTVSHPILTRLTIEEARAEIRESRASIQRHLDAAVDLFAYPNGTRADFSAPIQDLLREQGFRGAVTTVWGINGAESNPFELKRIGFWDSDPNLIPLRIAWYRFGG